MSSSSPPRAAAPRAATPLSPTLLGGGEEEEGGEMGGRGSPTVAQEVEEGADPFQESVVRFHLAMTDARLADGPAAQQAALRRVFEELGAMRAELYVAGGGGGGAAVQEEMLADCERKAGEVMLNLLRTATAAVAPDPEAAPGLFYECVQLRQEAKAANIYGGFLQRRLQEATDEALKALDAVRSLRRLQLGPSDSMAEDADINAPEQDSQPHVTGLNRVLGEASRVIGLLRGDAYYYDDPDSQPPAPPAMMAAPQGLVSPACLARMIQALNEIALKQAVKLLKWYAEDCGVRRWQERCLARDPSIVVQELDFALDELHLLLGLCNRYLAFVPAPREEALELLIQTQELLGCYVSMEDAYCALNVAKAIALGQPTEVADGVRVSTIVEDVPMILNRSIARATQTLSAQAILAVATRATELLSPESEPSFAGALQALVHDRSVDEEEEGQGKKKSALDEFSKALERELDEEEGNVSHAAMIYAINSTDCAVAAMRKMRDMLLDLSRRGDFSWGMMDSNSSNNSSRGQMNMVEAVAQEFGRVLRQYEADLATLLDDFAARYASSGVLEHVAEVVGKQLSYAIDAAAFEKESAARADPFVTRFLDHLFVRDRVLRDCQRSMTDTALVVFVERVVRQLVPALVAALKGKRFTEWGALKLRQQVRVLQERLVELVDGKATLLPQFARLDHMVALLNLESPADIQYLAGSFGAAVASPSKRPPPPPPGGGGRSSPPPPAPREAGDGVGLSPEEVRQVLKLRVEFDPGVVDRLKIP